MTKALTMLNQPVNSLYMNLNGQSNNLLVSMSPLKLILDYIMLCRSTKKIYMRTMRV
jgi:hypothetical protein